MSRADLSPLFTWRSAIAESDLQPTGRLVALTLSLHMSERGDSCFPSLDTLARETGLAKRSVVRALHVLEEAGYLRVRRSKGGRGRPNHYAATIPEKRSLRVTVSRSSGAVTRGDPAKQSPHVTVSAETGDLATGNGDTRDEKQGHPVTGERQEDVNESDTSGTALSRRARDPIFDAVALAWLGTLDPSTIRGRAADRIGTAKAELVREYQASAEQVLEFAAQWRQHYPGADCTPQAITDHWPAFLAGVLASPRSNGSTSPVQRARQAAAALRREGL